MVRYAPWGHALFSAMVSLSQPRRAAVTVRVHLIHEPPTPAKVAGANECTVTVINRPALNCLRSFGDELEPPDFAQELFIKRRRLINP